MSFLNKYRGALGLENEDLEKEVDTEQEEQVEEQSEETTEQVEEKTEEQVEEQVEESTDEESKEESEEESENTTEEESEEKTDEEQETVVPAEPEETTEEAIQLDDSEAPAAGGSRLQAYREAAGLVEEETVTETETETTTEEVEEETSEEESEDKTEDKADESVKALEALRDEIMVSYQRGGMTEGEASMVNVAVNNILARNGLQAERVVPSIESFSENSTRRRLATSTTADMINRIISKIKK